MCVPVGFGVGGLVLLALSSLPKRWNAEGRHDAIGVFMLLIGLGLLAYPAYYGISKGAHAFKPSPLSAMAPSPKGRNRSATMGAGLMSTCGTEGLRPGVSALRFENSGKRFQRQTKVRCG